MKLTKEQRESQTWAVIKEDIAQRIESLRTDLEKSTLTPEQTALVRGEVKGLRRLLLIEQKDAAFKE